MTAYIVLVTMLLQTVSRKITSVVGATIYSAFIRDRWVGVKKTKVALCCHCGLGSWIHVQLHKRSARMNGFKGADYHLNVVTLGGVTIDLTVIRYERWLISRDITEGTSDQVICFTSTTPIMMMRNRLVKTNLHLMNLRSVHHNESHYTIRVQPWSVTALQLLISSSVV